MRTIIKPSWLITLLFCTIFNTATIAQSVDRHSTRDLEARSQIRKFGIDKILFIKRFTYTANHYYTEFQNSKWLPGGNICLLNLTTGKVTDILPNEMERGVFGRFDLSYDAKKIIFDWKASEEEGYRIYEVNINGTNLRQLTFPVENEKELQAKYRIRAYSIKRYSRGTDDMHPCYLPDGDIVFTSSRCLYSTLCANSDGLTTTSLYKMDANGKNIRKLTNNSVSEHAPIVLSDGRIMYTRWDYVNKGTAAAKCLWSMRPDGSGSAEVYGGNNALPPTLIWGREIPNTSNKFVAVGTPHYPNAAIGTVVKIDTSKNIRTREPLSFITDTVDIRSEGGFHFKDANGKWRRDGSGRSGCLYRDPYPLSENLFMVSRKEKGAAWTDPKGYSLVLLNDKGEAQSLYSDPNISCWQPYPLKQRKRPTTPQSAIDIDLKKRNLAACIVTDVYSGMENVKRGDVKYIRILEHLPRPWSARRWWRGDSIGLAHVAIAKYKHLGLKVQHGIVPVEEDGSAYFLVPANKNIFMQALDENYMALQSERTFVNYIPGEVRSCIGCHESTNSAPAQRLARPMALSKPPVVPVAQLGEESGRRLLDYRVHVQPVLDRRCISCHGDTNPKAGLNLTGRMTKQFSTSYEQLLDYKRNLVGKTINESSPNVGNVHYLPTYSIGSHSSILVSMLSKGKVKLQDPKQQQRADTLAKVHVKITLSSRELLKISNWVDTNCQFYGSWWGRRNIIHKNHPNFRPFSTFEEAVSLTPPIAEEKR